MSGSRQPLLGGGGGGGGGERYDNGSMFPNPYTGAAAGGGGAGSGAAGGGYGGGAVAMGNPPPTNPSYSPPHLKPVEMPTFNGATPDQDLDEHHQKQAPVPSAPPADLFRPVGGYETVNPIQGLTMSPPPAALPPPVPSNHGRIPTSVMIPVLTQDQARSALLDEVASHCCWGKGPARDMFFTDIKASHAFHYKLETFTEKRKVLWEFVPYHGQAIDSPAAGPAPGPWSIPAHPNQLFRNQTFKVEVPHTASVVTCNHCLGRKQVRCHKCCGRGRLRCASCRGCGYRNVKRDSHTVRETCTNCFGTGRKRCPVCYGHGQVHCPQCLATGQLKTFLQLTIKWTNHSNDHTVQETPLPQHHVQNAPGTEVFREEGVMVPPVSQFPSDSINTGSHGLISRHNYEWPMEKILRQRHVVRSVPVYEAHYTHKDQLRLFYVYGLDHKVHCPDYSATCCWGCTVM